LETDDSRGNEAVAMIAILVASDNSFKILLNIARYNNIYINKDKRKTCTRIL
jgi:hypothetical protein